MTTTDDASVTDLPQAAPTATANPWFLYGIFFVSGAAALIYQVVFGKELTYVFGSMGTATNTVLATYMGGMALGAWIGGVLAPKLRKPIAAYAICESAIAVYCAASPLIFALIRNAYVAIASGHTPDNPALLPLRVLLGGAGLIVPTVAMGLTLPILARFFEQRRDSLGLSVGRLYASNTLGAAFGALAAGYFILPALGVRRTTLVAVAANLLVAWLALRFQKRFATQPQPTSANGQAEPVVTAVARKQGRIALLVLAVGGFVTLALEVDFIHLLAVAAGNSTYAFSLMLFAFLIGLGGGAEAGRWTMRRVQPLFALAWFEFGLCIVILLGATHIDLIPGFFDSFAASAASFGWAKRELIRGIACCMAMVPPAFFIGAIFPLAIECVGRGFPGSQIRMLGFASALNTLGNILGVLVAGFVLLPRIGPLPSIRILAAACFVLGLCALAFSRDARHFHLALVPAGAAALTLLFGKSTLDYGALTSGANVYFATQPQGQLIDKAESLDGGLTSVHQMRFVDGEVLTTLLTNGKFQGNDGGQMPAQMGFALAPLLHVSKRDSALVIGYGTGNTSRVMHDAGFRQLDVVDISADILRLSNDHFPHLNDRVTEQANVTPYVTDGRNFLLLSQGKYDLISMELTSIWFAGAASLYSRDYYKLARAHLSDDGVLQQWIQYHHMTPLDMLYVLGSMRAEFRYLWVYLIGGQGMVIATNNPDLRPSPANAAVLEANPQLKSTIAWYGGSVRPLFQTILLDPDGVDRFLDSTGLPASYFVSDDDNAHLEYSTPKGNALDYDQSMQANLYLLSKFSQPAPVR